MFFYKLDLLAKADQFAVPLFKCRSRNNSHHVHSVNDESHNTILVNWFLFFALFFCVLSSALSAPYPEEGLLTEWVQPDGTPLVLRVFGDEFYARTTTDDGYTVIFDPADKTYYYAIVGPDGGSLVSSNVAADKAPPRNLEKHLNESKEIAAAKRAKNIEIYAPDRSADWAARKKAVQAARAREAESKDNANDPLQPPIHPAKSSDPTLE